MSASPPTCRTTCSGCMASSAPSTGSARPPCGPGGARDAICRSTPSTLPASGPPPRMRYSAVRNAVAFWSAPPSRVCDAPAGRRGRRRLPRESRPGRVRGRGARRGDRGGARRGERERRPGHQQCGRVLSAHRWPAGRGRARAWCRRRGPDGLQTGRRADVGPLADQAPRHAPARGDGQGEHAGAGPGELHMGAALAQHARRPAGQRGHGQRGTGPGRTGGRAGGTR